MSEVKLQSTEALMRHEPNLTRFREIYEISKKDRHAAIPLYEELSGQGSLLAKIYLAYIYRGLNESERALYWFNQAYDEGSVEAALLIGDLNSKEGRLSEAEFFYRKGAEAGDPICKYKVTDMIAALGRKELAASEIEQTLKSAIEGGSIRAKNRLAFHYMSGLYGFKKRFTGIKLYASLIYDAATETRRDIRSRRLW